MASSLYDPAVDALLRNGGDGRPPFPSPADWRDQWIYLLLVDRFANPGAPPQPAPPSNAKSRGSLRTVALSLAPMEAQVLG